MGTGVHLLRLTRGADGVVLADAWLTLAFLPVVPLGEWIVEREGSTRDPCVIRQVRPPRLRKSILWIVCGVLAGLLSLLPAYGALTFLMGSRAAELAGVFGSMGVILGTLGWLDETRDRVPIWVALRAVTGVNGGREKGRRPWPPGVVPRCACSSARCA